jgi:hypothetical protein
LQRAIHYAPFVVDDHHRVFGQQVLGDVARFDRENPEIGLDRRSVAPCQDGEAAFAISIFASYAPTARYRCLVCLISFPFMTYRYEE